MHYVAYTSVSVMNIFLALICSFDSCIQTQFQNARLIDLHILSTQ